MAVPAAGGRLEGMTQNIDPARHDATASDSPGSAGSTDPVTAPPAVVPPPPARPSHFTLRRSRSDRMLGGVCGGLAAGLGADPALLRVLVVALTLLTGGAAAVVYLAAWVLAPEDVSPAA